MRIFLLILFFNFSNPVFAVTRVTYYHTDALGSPVVATDELGEVKWRAAYMPFGENLSDFQSVVAATLNPIWFAGHVQDVQTGLSYMQGRYYNPVFGRFMGPDPAAFRPSDPASFNRYAYARNNPFRYVDPDGEDAIVFSLALRAPKALDAVQSFFDTEIRITGVDMGIGFSLADSDGNGIPEPDIGLVGSLEMNAYGIGGARANLAIQRSMSGDPALADLAGFSAFVEIDGPGLGGKLSVAEDGTVMLSGLAGAAVPGATVGAEGTGICSLQAGCKGWNADVSGGTADQSDDSMEPSAAGTTFMRNMTDWWY